MKKSILAAFALLLACAFAAGGCYPLRVAKNPNPQPTAPVDAQIPDDEPVKTEPVETEPALTEADETEPAATEAEPTAEATEAAATPEATETAEDTAAPSESAQASAAPTQSAASTTPAPSQSGNATAGPTATPKPTATPTPKPTATPTPAPTATPASTGDFSEFSSSTINGYGNFSNATFGRSRLTMVNFWATWCGPCIEELPYIQQLSSTYSGRMQIMTVLYDSSTDGAVDQALSIINGLGVTLPVARCNKSVKSAFTAHNSLNSLPTTFFVDQNGHIVKIVSGSNTYDSWCALINGLL